MKKQLGFILPFLICSIGSNSTVLHKYIWYSLGWRARRFVYVYCFCPISLRMGSEGKTVTFSVSPDMGLCR